MIIWAGVHEDTYGDIDVELLSDRFAISEKSANLLMRELYPKVDEWVLLSYPARPYFVERVP